MRKKEFRFHCPRCKREIKEISVREEEAKRASCPHCRSEFDIQKALEASGESFLKKVAKDFQHELDKISRRFRN